MGIFKLRGYLKPFLIPVLLAICFLFIQALCELNLPNYMSTIINIGIQQNGIEESAPKALISSRYAQISLYLTQEEKQLLENSYLETKNNENTEPLKQMSNGETVFFLSKDILEDEQEKLNILFNQVAWILGEEEGKNLNAEEKATLRQRAENVDSALLHQKGIYQAGEFYKEAGGELEQIQRAYIIKVGLIMLLVALFGGVATILVGFFAARAAAGVARNLRKDLFAKIESFSQKEFDTFSTASLITRSTNDVAQIQQLIGIGIRFIFFAPIMGIGGIIMALNKSVSMGWIIALGVLVIIGVILLIFSLVMPRFKIMQYIVDRLNLVAREALNGLLVIRAFGTEDFEKNRFKKVNTEYAKNNLFVGRAMMVMMNSMTLAMNLITVIIVWVGAHYVAESQMQVGDMMAFMQYAMLILMSFFMISMMSLFIPRAAVSAQRISEVLKTEPSIISPTDGQAFLEDKKGYVEFKNVSFKYENAEEDALKNISFIAKPGQTTAFIGATGSGKSTLISLIPRFYDATEGEILVNGVNVKDLALKDLRKIIGYVPQKTLLMSGTLASNIKYGNPELSYEEMQTVSQVTQSMQFISEKSEGFESEISQGGTNISGGQKQRIAIARALAIKPEIMLFDDSFSALDYKTDSTLRLALKKHTGDITVIMVAQRVSTIINAEQIFVVDKGKIVGHGTHQELLFKCPEYYEIVSSQLTEEEF